MTGPNSRGPVNDLDKKDVTDQESAVFGSAVRTGLRYSARIMDFLPNRIHARHIASSADGLSSIMEIITHIRDGNADNKHYSVTTRRQFAHARTLLFTVPKFLRAMIFDSALFYLYERSVDKFPGLYNELALPYKAASFHPTSLVPVAAVCAGVGGGALHGYLSGQWDARYYDKLQHHKVHRNLKGLVLSGSIVHGLLFGVYETVKTFLLSHMLLTENHDDLTRLEGFMCISCAGVTSGTCSEVAAHYCEAFEISGISDGFKRIRWANGPTVRSLLPGIFSNAVGFISYEYTKEKFNYLHEN